MRAVNKKLLELVSEKEPVCQLGEMDDFSVMEQAQNFKVDGFHPFTMRVRFTQEALESKEFPVLAAQEIEHAAEGLAHFIARHRRFAVEDRDPPA